MGIYIKTSNSWHMNRMLSYAVKNNTSVTIGDAYGLLNGWMMSRWSMSCGMRALPLFVVGAGGELPDELVVSHSCVLRVSAGQFVRPISSLEPAKTSW